MRVIRIGGQGVIAMSAHKLRSFFMMAGTIVGIAALIVIMAIGKGTERKVKGVLEHRGTGGMGGVSDFDNRIVIPITTAMRRVMNVDYVGAIRIVTTDAGRMREQAETVRQLIHERHHITPPQEDDFRIITSSIIAELARGTSRMLSLLLAALAGLSLIVGGVVMMNILLISVAERTGEIGLRRAIGAKRSDIFLQFLTESLCVSVIGMLLGGVLGWALSMAVGHLTPTPAVLSWESFGLALGFALLVGTFFGIQPARRAARLHPVEALR